MVGGEWIGVDFDGTLAEYGTPNAGRPIMPMVERVKAWLAGGHKVRIVTAKAAFPDMVAEVEAWCERHLGKRLPVTNCKDFGMLELWDDRCVQVRTNTGEIVSNGGNKQW